MIEVFCVICGASGEIPNAGQEPWTCPACQARASAKPDKKTVGVGMPAGLWLNLFGDVIFQTFGAVAFHVGSSLTGREWRDVDVRVLLSRMQWDEWGFGNPKAPHESPRWAAMTMSFSELGRKMTGLPIDFQVQDQETANADFPNKPRSALLMTEVRRSRRIVTLETALRNVIEASRQVGVEADLKDFHEYAMTDQESEDRWNKLKLAVTAAKGVL